MNLTGPWIDTAYDVLYYAWPATLGLGVLLCFIALMLLAKAVHSSTESFLIGLTIASLLLLVAKGAQKLEKYIGHNDKYQYANGYMIAAHDWFWYTSCWLVLVMCLERCLGQCSRHPTPGLGLCRPLQAGIATVVLYCLCFGAALPQFWEWEVTEYQKSDNTTFLQSERSTFYNTSAHYKTIYFWFETTITTFVPLPVMFLLIILLCCQPGIDDDTKPQAAAHAPLMSHPHAGPPVHRPRPPPTGPGLYVHEIFAYLFFTAPYTLFMVLPHLIPRLYPENDRFYLLLEEMLDLWFHLFFVIQLEIMLLHSPSVRKACCCCCRSRGPHDPPGCCDGDDDL